MKCFYFFRSKGILPYDHNRVELEEYIDADDYVNASWIGGDGKLIATQGPLPTTVKHFLQMIVEREVELIVMLGTHMEKDNKGMYYIVHNCHLCGSENLFTTIMVCC